MNDYQILRISTLIPPIEAALCKKLKNICRIREESIEDFELMTETASDKQTMSWQKLAEEADREWLNNVSAMDIYNIQVPKGKFTL